ncbi:MAG TPA: TolC family protein [Polyangiaceae bacterium]|nr:TolC family protein [Polyangiaceae bacterium]
MKRSLALLMSVVLPACASMQKELGHEDVAKLVERRSGHRTGWEQGAPEEQQIADRVNKLLEGGLTRERAVSIALINSPHLQEIYESLDISQADLVQAGLLSNPTLAGSIGFPMKGGGRAEYEVSIVQSFLDIFMLPLRKRIAKEQFVAATLRVAHEALDAASEVSKAVAEVQSDVETVELMRRLTDAAQASADLAQRQFDAGNVSERVRVNELGVYEQARLELARVEIELVEHREHLNRMLGFWGPRTSWKLTEALPLIPSQDPLPDHLERVAMKQRLDIGSAKRELALMDTALGLARTSRYTGLIDVGAHMHQDPDGPLVLGPTLSLELPIFDQRQAVIGRLQAQRRQAQRRVDGLAINARSEVRLASAKLALARRNAEQYRKSLLPVRAAVLEQAQLEYNGMQIGLYELLAAKQAQVDAVRAYIETVRDYWIARAELERALGGRVPAASSAAAPVESASTPKASPPASPDAPTHVHGGQ